ncbi:MAG: hypothetical protein ABMB14_16180, partial [Myxococcota bacterium]
MAVASAIVGFVLAAAGIGWLGSVYPIEARLPTDTVSPDARRYRISGNGPGALGWLLTVPLAIVAAMVAGLSQAVPLAAVGPGIAVLAAGLGVALGQVGPAVEVTVGLHQLQIRRGWFGRPAPWAMPWDELAVASVARASTDELELLVAGAEGPLIRTGVVASADTIRQLVADIDAALARHRHRRPAADRRALE